MEDVLPILEQLLCKFEKPFTIDTHVLSTSTSIGVALYPEHGNTFEQLLQNADTAMYKAKENGKNTYCFYAEQMNIDTAREFQIQNDLKKAIANSEFVLYYQPQIDLELNRITGAEALIRWKRPELGMVPPMDFIPLAEATGLIVPIGEWVIMEACRQAALWAKKGVELTIAVNISAVQFKRGDLEDVVKRALSISKLNPKLLELELTESVMVHDIEIILATVQRLKLLGIQLSIDDFGTGYSSLSYLKRFAVDKLKIDQSFVRDILIDDDD
ncbi:MAG: phosphodiesterase, partial [Sulfurimonas sp. CG01_land_8_20_14_3_00_36_23]